MSDKDNKTNGNNAEVPNRTPLIGQGRQVPKGGQAAPISTDTSINIGHPLDAALAYAKLGFEVFPSNPRTKSSYKSESVAGSKWGKTTDLKQIRADWRKWPNANVGIATGRDSGFWVLDLDVKDDGLDTWAALIPNQEPVQQTVTVETPSGGRHYWFKWPQDANIRNSVRKIGPGIDVRGESGIVIAPPSAKAGRRNYRFARGLSPNEVQLADAPAWLLELVCSSRHLKTLSEALPFSSSRDQGQLARTSTARKVNMRVADLLDQLVFAKEGERNDTLNRTAYTIGGLVHNLDPQQTLERLLKVVERWESPEKTLATAERAFQDGLRSPINLELCLDDLQLSHDDLAQYAIGSGWAKDIINVFELGWYKWSRHTWRPQQEQTVRKEIADQLWRVRNEADMIAAAEAERARANARSGHNIGARSERKVLNKANSLRNHLGSDPVDKAVLSKLGAKRGRSAKTFNTDLQLLGTPGGVVDLKTGEMRPGRREDKISRSTSVAPAPVGTRSEDWEQFLRNIFPDQPQTIEFLQKLAGYALTGHTREEKFFFFHGSGRNGKGTFLETLYSLLGDYAAVAPSGIFLRNSKDNVSNFLSGIDGTRMVWASEIDRGMSWNEAMLKEITGGDTITAKKLYKDPYSFKPQATLIVAGNTQPNLKGVDKAMRSRMVMVPFAQTFAGKEDRGLKARLIELEAPAILRWAVDGARMYLENGLVLPAAVKAASQEYLDGEDTLQTFVDEECLVEDGTWTSTKVIHAHYVEWCQVQGLRPWTLISMVKAFKEHGFTTGRRNSKSGIHRLSLRDEDGRQM